jgi:hypothetical protein
MFLPSVVFLTHGKEPLCREFYYCWVSATGHSAKRFIVECPMICTWQTLWHSAKCRFPVVYMHRASLCNSKKTKVYKLWTEKEPTEHRRKQEDGRFLKQSAKPQLVDLCSIPCMLLPSAETSYLTDIGIDAGWQLATKHFSFVYENMASDHNRTRTLRITTRVLARTWQLSSF